jgi:WS/DGAT/MGAT family acyltransferase
MPSRLTTLDASFLFLDRETTPMHAGGLAIFTPPEGGLDLEQLIRLVRQRLPFVPRYRQRVRNIPFGVARPVWVDDENFDISYHVRRSALPKPGTREQLDELVARIISRRLDRDRPLWELYLIEGLQDGQVAIVSKTHEALVDGVSAVDIAQVLLDETPEVPATPGDTWQARREPRGVELLTEAVAEIAARPGAAIDALRKAGSDATSIVQRVGGKVGGALSTVAAVARPTPASPLNVEIGAQRRFASIDMPLADVKQVRAVLGGTVNDAILAVLSGGLRSWLLARGQGVSQGDVLRAMLPVSIAIPAHEGDSLGSKVAATIVDLPVGEPDPAVRVQQVSYQMAQLEENDHFVGASNIADIAGFGPPTLHALGARLGASLTRRVYNLVITNVPGPQHPLYAAGARMTAAYPVVPLGVGQALSIGLTSYDGGVYLGLFADRDALPDLDVLVACLHDARMELVERCEERRRLREVPQDRA